jgi:hypothetical protein
MSRMLRRFEVLLPLRFNDGSPVPDDAVADTLLELEQRFGSVSCETQTIRGQWRHEGQNYRDDLIRVSWTWRTSQSVDDFSSSTRSGSKPGSSNSISG